MHGEYDAKGARIHGLDVLQQFESVFVGQCEIDDDQIRLVLAYEGESLGCTPGTRTDIETFLCTNELGKAVPHDRVIIDEKNPLPHFFFREGRLFGGLGTGTLHFTTVPPKSSCSTVSDPLIILARWLIVRRPMPVPLLGE